jgi:hypothetical protein
MQDVTAIWAPKIARILTKNEIVATLEFPSLTFGHRAYSPSDYRRVGEVMGKGKIEVYAGTGDKFKASYTNAKDGDYFVINPEHLKTETFDDDPAQIATIVHESTHMVQDDKRLRMSNCERELDAHFAQALYLVRAGAPELYDKDYARKIMEAAQAYEADPGFRYSRAFREMRDVARGKINDHYQYNMMSQADYDPDAFNKVQRWDGLKE